MRFTLAAALTAGLVHSAAAYAPQKGAERPLVAAGRAARAHRDVTWLAPKNALAQLPGWRVLWDRDVDVPLRLWGPPIAAPNASADAAAAEAAARWQLATHLALLAPGAQLADFTLLANQLDAGVRTVTFAQHAAGLPVVGGSIAFTFSHDRLIAMSSTALPHVSVRVPVQTLPQSQLGAAATHWIGDAQAKSFGQRVIVPIVHSRGTGSNPDIEYRVAETVTVEAQRGPGLWDVWVDAWDASPIARASQLHFASGTVLFDTPDRWPGGTRSGKPAPNAAFTVGAGAVAVTSLVDGSVTWSDANPVNVVTTASGPLIRVVNKAGAAATDTLTLAPGGSIMWSKAADEFGDAQLTAFIAASTGKAFVRARLNPSLAWLDQQMVVNVNETQTCNAYSTGDAVHFFRKDTKCENTGRLPDVVYHEFGHSVHNQSVIPGEGQFDSSLSEGLADTMAASITGDHGMGRGFFFTDAALRDLDPVGVEKKWPDDADGEPHDEGEIIGEALWDLRTSLQTTLGDAAGFERFLKLYYGVMQRAADIPSSYVAALIADDDDGNLANGTPNQCTINSAFAPHGLVDPSVTLGLTPPKRDGMKISITLHPPTDSPCPPPSLTSATLMWTPRGGNGSEIQLVAAGDTWSGEIPAQPDGTVVLYHVTLAFSDGSSITFPQNKADPEYQLYAGNVTALWCADFEGGLDGWTPGGTPTANVEWEAGMPMGIGGDPATAHGGANVLGIDLGGDDGFYSPRTNQYVESPDIDLQGQTKVRLQYWRWLNTEDGVYDPATISINDQLVWQNYTSMGMPSSDEVNHTDKEWRFQDVDISDKTGTGKVKIKFSLKSDDGLELAGWNVDDVCLVTAGPPPSMCENGSGSDCPPKTDGGCCSVGTSPAGSAALALFTLGLVFRRRRRSS